MRMLMAICASVVLLTATVSAQTVQVTAKPLTDTTSNCCVRMSCGQRFRSLLTRCNSPMQNPLHFG